jgi:hypothetical protein
MNSVVCAIGLLCDLLHITLTLPLKGGNNWVSQPATPPSDFQWYWISLVKPLLLTLASGFHVLSVCNVVFMWMDVVDRTDRTQPAAQTRVYVKTARVLRFVIHSLLLVTVLAPILLAPTELYEIITLLQVAFGVVVGVCVLVCRSIVVKMLTLNAPAATSPDRQYGQRNDGGQVSQVKIIQTTSDRIVGMCAAMFVSACIIYFSFRREGRQVASVLSLSMFITSMGLTSLCLHRYFVVALLRRGGSSRTDRPVIPVIKLDTTPKKNIFQSRIGTRSAKKSHRPHKPNRIVIHNVTTVYAVNESFVHPAGSRPLRDAVTRSTRIPCRPIHTSLSSLEPITALPNNAILDHPKESESLSNEVLEESDLKWIDEDGWLADEAFIRAELDHQKI